MENLLLYRLKHELITNDSSNTMYDELTSSLSGCKSFLFNVAFISYSGLQLLLRALSQCEIRNTTGRIITSDYLNFTDTKSLRKLKEFNTIETKIFIARQDRGFHSKAYIFEYDNHYKIIIGSTNITQSALKTNIEWNVKIVTKRSHPFTVKVIHEFEELWSKTQEIDERFLEEYEKLIEILREANEKETEIFYQDHTVIANTMQNKAIYNLNWLRDRGEMKALVIAATATGKTYMSAFDVKQFRPNRVLFIVHRENILIKAEESFKRVLGSRISTGFLTGIRNDQNAKYVFATIQTLNNHYQEFKRDDFDYIIVDEAHHVCAPSYKSVMEYFQPGFLLGMTATPERMDGVNLFDVFDNNIALEIRLREAMESDLVVPFHYFGITEVDEVDLSDIESRNENELVRRLCINERVDYIIEKMEFYGYDGKKRKTLGFCQNVLHARYMEEQFIHRGIQSKCITGDSTILDREEAIRKLEDDNDPLEVIFTVDVFNEGIDIPSVNNVLMLRPTNSAIVFIQQLGRGMRKHKSKEYLTVLDFIGNYNRAFLVAIALNGSRYYDKDGLMVAVKNDFADIPGPTVIQMDSIAKELILRQLEAENFNAMEHLKIEYNSFKIQIGKEPIYLSDYEAYDGAPDPLKFVNKKGSYYEFVCGMLDTEDLYKNHLSSQEFIKVLRQISDFLPLKRPHEFVLLKSVFDQQIDIDELYSNLNSVIEVVSPETCTHAIKNLELEYKDETQRMRLIKLIENDNGLMRTSSTLRNLLNDEAKKTILTDIIQYGLLRYYREFGPSDYGTPFFKLYYPYQMVDIALLSNYEKSHSSYRGSGLLTNGNHYFLFVDLHKDDNTPAAIFYKDKLLDDSHFQWQTPNSTKQNSARGRNIISNVENNIHLHLFIRKFKKVDGISQPYIYLGEAVSESAQGDKPITVQMRLLNQLPKALFDELTIKVEI
ncbi:MAG TPA: DUF3427 domain-containing protein [Erysipelotrichaceae bacterium]|nr:DUF3427 domain-containing protein [Erysipelotrichaceae bacterium]